jgi:hypothetical protein
MLSIVKGEGKLYAATSRRSGTPELRSQHDL